MTKQCYIEIDGNLVVDKDLQISKDFNKKMIFSTKRRAKKIANFLKRYGVKKVIVKEL